MRSKNRYDRSTATPSKHVEKVRVHPRESPQEWSPLPRGDAAVEWPLLDSSPAHDYAARGACAIRTSAGAVRTMHARTLCVHCSRQLDCLEVELCFVFTRIKGFTPCNRSVLILFLLVRVGGVMEGKLDDNFYNLFASGCL